MTQNNSIKFHCVGNKDGTYSPLIVYSEVDAELLPEVTLADPQAAIDEGERIKASGQLYQHNTVHIIPRLEKHGEIK